MSRVGFFSMPHATLSGGVFTEHKSPYRGW